MQQLQLHDPSVTDVCASHFMWTPTIDDDEVLLSLAQALIGNTHVKKLSFSTKRIGLRTARAMAKAIRQSKITYLDLSDMKDSQIANVILLEGIKRSDTVNELRIVMGYGVVELADILPCLRKLLLLFPTSCELEKLQEHLRNSDLSELQLQRKCGQDYRLVLASLVIPSLKTFTLCEIALPRNFLESWQYQDSQLETLELLCCWIENVATSIIQAAANLPNLRTLHIQAHAWLPSELKFTAAVLETNTFALHHLRFFNSRLDLSDKERTDVVQAFCKAMQSNTHLLSLEIENLIVNKSDQDLFDRTIRCYTGRNHVRSLLAASQNEMPVGIWCHILAHYLENPDCIFYALQQLPNLVTV